MNKFLAFTLAIGICFSVGILHGVEAQEQISPSSPAYQKAFTIAKVVDELIRATRKHYTDMVVKKLKGEGAGASLEYKADKGFVPLPAVFMRRVAFETAFQQGRADEWLYNVALLSRWNLNEDQGLQGDFDQRGWEFLAKQQKDYLASGKPLKNIIWEPYIEAGRLRGQRVLRYLSADPASAKPCVSCHNAWERKEEIQNKRAKQGIEVGKVFERHELLGALSITVPLQ